MSGSLRFSAALGTKGALSVIKREDEAAIFRNYSNVAWIRGCLWCRPKAAAPNALTSPLGLKRPDTIIGTEESGRRMKPNVL
ncbi:hypothetical protein TcWFU_002501 [Taenia crassiceps]|uniref:Uncharacterized protein n=1 Tax=Taenia crassiceps TaxID=6207 RepID=A0ABR4Q1V8_9CEST